jgi:hypothetical protein
VKKPTCQKCGKRVSETFLCKCDTQGLHKIPDNLKPGEVAAGYGKLHGKQGRATLAVCKNCAEEK